MRLVGLFFDRKKTGVSIFVLMLVFMYASSLHAQSDLTSNILEGFKEATTRERSIMIFIGLAALITWVHSFLFFYFKRSDVSYSFYILRPAIFLSLLFKKPEGIYKKGYAKFMQLYGIVTLILGISFVIAICSFLVIYKPIQSW